MIFSLVFSKFFSPSFKAFSKEVISFKIEKQATIPFSIQEFSFTFPAHTIKGMACFLQIEAIPEMVFPFRLYSSKLPSPVKQ